MIVEFPEINSNDIPKELFREIDQHEFKIYDEVK